MTAPALAVPSSAAHSTQAILHAYRALYRTALQAVHFSTPARYQIRNIIRASFRYEPPSNFCLRRVGNTVKFLERAKEYNDVEHKVLRNLLHVAYWRRDIAGGLDDVTTVAPTPAFKSKKFSKKKTESVRVPWLRGNDDNAISLRRDLYSHFDATVVLLNESMDLCLRSIPLVDLSTATPTSETEQPEDPKQHNLRHSYMRLSAKRRMLESDESYRNGHTKQPHRTRKRRELDSGVESQSEENSNCGPNSTSAAPRKIFR